LSSGFKMAARMVNVGLDEYTIYVYLSYQDFKDGHWCFKEVHTDYDMAVRQLEELEALHGDEWFFNNDFESLV